MAKVESRRPGRSTQAKKITKKVAKWNFPLEKKDFIWLAISIGVVILGYALLATGITDNPAEENSTWMNFWAVSVAPIVILIGYIVLIPMSLMKIFTLKKNKKIAPAEEAI